MVEAACWARLRRKFHDLHVARPSPQTIEVLRPIAELYLIQADACGLFATELEIDIGSSPFQGFVTLRGATAFMMRLAISDRRLRV